MKHLRGSRHQLSNKRKKNTQTVDEIIHYRNSRPLHRISSKTGKTDYVTDRVSTISTDDFETHSTHLPSVSTSTGTFTVVYNETKTILLRQNHKTKVLEGRTEMRKKDVCPYFTRRHQDLRSREKKDTLSHPSSTTTTRFR